MENSPTKGNFLMVSTAISAALIGAVLGIRFKVVVLLPAIVVGVFSVALISAFSGDGAGTTALLAIVLVVTLQLGYLGGLLVRFVMAASRLRLSANSAALVRTR
jgi:hypothetical protein